MTAYADFRFASIGDLAYLGGPSSRFNHNIAAIKLLKSLESESRAHGDLAPDDQRTLARYSGWGDGEVLNRLFPYGAYPQSPIHPKLDGVLTIEERGKIASSALNAHYTALPIIGAIYEALNYLGIGALDSLRVLEPAAGIGHFFGVMPAEIVAKAERVAVELDSITARIMQYLYPNAKVFNQGFEESTMPNDYFDLVLSNTPFGNYAVHDPRIKERYLKAAIHDYFFVRSLKLVKPGGVIAFIFLCAGYSNHKRGGTEFQRTVIRDMKLARIYLWPFHTMVRTKSGGDSAIIPEFVIARLIFHPSWVES